MYKSLKKKKINLITKIVLFVIFIFIISILILGKKTIPVVQNLENILFDKFYFLFFDITNLIIIILIILAFSKYGKIKLGDEKTEVEYSNFAWYSMLFSAGMGIGIMFYAVAEPLKHYYNNPLFNLSNDTANSLATTYFSWGIHAWAIYALIGLIFAYFTYNKNLPLSLRSLFYPVLKDKIYSKIGDVIDAIGILITLFALSSSLGIGSIQINSGLQFLFGVPINPAVQIIIILFVITITTISVVSGVGKGVKLLSQNNLLLAIILGIIIFLIGPTLLILKNIFLSTSVYGVGIIKASYMINKVDSSWANTWSIFYISWWISWSIFVGIFIAKISKGRTIREFILSILLIPLLMTIIWFSILGVSAIYLDGGNHLSTIIDNEISLSLFAMIDLLVQNYVIKWLLQILGLLIIISFFITSSDSGSIVINELANSNKETSIKQKIFWTYMQALLTITLMLIGGVLALELIQNILIIISFPLLIFLLFIIFILIKTLRKDYKKKYNNKENNLKEKNE